LGNFIIQTYFDSLEEEIVLKKFLSHFWLSYNIYLASSKVIHNYEIPGHHTGFLPPFI